MVVAALLTGQVEMLGVDGQRFKQMIAKMAGETGVGCKPR
jgi:hypothetical protein